MPFNPALPVARDRVRLALGDTDAARPLLDDATYDAMLAHQGNDERQATLALAEALIAKFGQRPDKVKIEGGLDVTWGERIQGWRSLAERLRRELAPPGGFGIRRLERGERGTEYRPLGREW